MKIKTEEEKNVSCEPNKTISACKYYKNWREEVSCEPNKTVSACK